jgi:hypothetical protein
MTTIDRAIANTIWEDRSIALAGALRALIDIMDRCDVVHPGQPTDDEWDAAMAEAKAVLARIAA